MELEVWLTKQLKERRLSMSELGRKSNISHSTISRVLSGKQPPTSDFCKAISGALNVPQVEVEILAGILPKPPGWSPESEEWNALFHQLTEEERANVMTLGRSMAGRRGKQKNG
jgi:transcriptional regulator with XRE-family HTH domain